MTHIEESPNPDSVGAGYPEENVTDDETLGPCGCTDYHMSDCPTRTGTYDAAEDAYYSAYDREYGY